MRARSLMALSGPLWSSLNISTNQDRVYQLIMTEMKGFCQLCCGCCEGAHNVDEYGTSGPEFQPLHIRKAVQQYNLKHDTKPKSLSSEKPPMPRGSTFGPPAPRQATFGQQFWDISLPSSQDQVDDNGDIIYFKSSDPDNDSNPVKPPKSSLLQLHTLHTKADFDLTLR